MDTHRHTHISRLILLKLLILTGFSQIFAAEYRIGDAESGKELLKLTDHVTPTDITTFSPDGKKIASAGSNTVHIWDAVSGKEWQQLMGYGIAFSPDGKQMVTCGFPQDVARIWNIESGAKVQQFEGHTETVRSAVFSPDGKMVVTTSDDETARIWDASTGKELQTLQGDSNDRHDINDERVMRRQFLVRRKKEVSPAIVQFVSATFSPDGKKVITTGNLYEDAPARIWDVESGKELRSLAVGSTYAAFSPDGKKVLTVSNQGTAHIWDSEREPPPLVRPAMLDF